MLFKTSFAILALTSISNAASLTRNNQGTFNDGVIAGRKEAERIWRNNGSNCANIWGFDDQVQRSMNRNYANRSSDNWRQGAYKRGVREGADTVVAKYEKECLEDNSDECFDLGEAAAYEIAWAYCPTSASASHHYDYPNYKATCKTVAYGVCKGEISGAVKGNGCMTIPTSDLLDLQSKCRRQVDNMVGPVVQDA